jgi:hypothetical protein
MSSPAAKNISLFCLVETAIEQWPSRAHQEGRIAIVTKRGARDAVDAMAQKTKALSWTVKPCGPDSPTLESSRQNHFLPMTVTTKPGSPGRARK